MSDIFDVLQQRFIRQTSAEASSARRTAADARREIAALEDQVGRLTLVCTSLWELFRERLDVSNEELFAKLREVDLRDGSLDGRHTLKATTCPRCNRISNARHVRCLYCGEEFSAAPG